MGGGSWNKQPVNNDYFLAETFHFTGNYGTLCGDSGYPERRYMLTPILNPTTRAEERYNEAQQGTRVPIEQTYGILKNRYSL